MVLSTSRESLAASRLKCGSVVHIGTTCPKAASRRRDMRGAQLRPLAEHRSRGARSQQVGATILVPQTCPCRDAHSAGAGLVARPWSRQVCIIPSLPPNAVPSLPAPPSPSHRCRARRATGDSSPDAAALTSPTAVSRRVACCARRARRALRRGRRRRTRLAAAADAAQVDRAFPPPPL